MTAKPNARGYMQEDFTAPDGTKYRRVYGSKFLRDTGFWVRYGKAEPGGPLVPCTKAEFQDARRQYGPDPVKAAAWQEGYDAPRPADNPYGSGVDV